MLSHLSDRRCKPEGEHLQHLVKPRFTDEEFERIQAEAAMRHSGRLASLVHEATMLGLDVMRQRREALLARLANGEAPPPEDLQELECLLAEMADRQLSSSIINQSQSA
ncbi:MULTISPECIES: hypothetical protein [Halomonas]|uniref:hypothetical protein n=1 Tax=Halomonas TaxID=2745 RepID=UPI001C976D1A|nr:MULTISPECIES: hypothetical protein [Halomonas]MBY6209063.1 hypothetical protein [Halomonas sp. DP3Y7-2]MBY6229218.1 hypothetical protein [Halomonas sp. DP3Y7-1]MCA0917719.1 hypothetical protein [Halomonas denitrificans]